MEFLHIAGWMEHLTEVAVLVSLFVSGLKLRMPLRHPAWKSAYVLAGPVMLACIGGVTLLCYYVFGLSWGVAVLIGAILAPTDPVLASLVQVNDARDSDRLRYGLSGEAGFNDGTAFPFVVFGLMLIAQGQLEADWVGEWALHRLLWAVPAGLLIGFLLGKLVGRVAIYLRARHTDTAMSPNDSPALALALIALAYVGAELAGAWGFLAVFAAGLGLRHAEMAAADDSETPSEELINDAVPHLAEGGLAPRALSLDDRQLGQPRVAAGVLMGDVLAFGGQLERSLEVLLVTMLGVLVSVHWDWRAARLGAVPADSAAERDAADAAPRPRPRPEPDGRLVRHSWHRQPVLPELRGDPRPAAGRGAYHHRPGVIGGSAEHRAARTQHPAATASLRTQPRCRRLNGGRAWRSAVLEAEADLHGHLEVPDLAVLDVAANLANLEPLDVLQLAAGFGDAVLNCFVDAVARGADNFNLLVRVMIRH